MKKITILIGFLIASFQLYAQDQKIYGGTSVDIEDAPYQISLEFNGNHGCGGTIIDCEWIVTAGHCVDGNTNPANLTVHAGATNQNNNGDGQRIGVAEIIIHPSYGQANGVLVNDIALLRLETPLELNEDVRAIEYATPANTSAADIASGVEAFISGWGDSGGGCCNNNLLGAALPIVDNATAGILMADSSNACPPNNNTAVGNSMISFWQEGIAAGPGDSGGPAVLGRGGDAVLIGVSSWGGCVRDDFPTIYANVRNLSGFIDSNINVNDCCSDTVNYHYEDSSGNDQTEFCLGEDVFVNGSDTFNTGNYFMDLWVVDSNGDYDWISGAGWISGSPDFVNITDLFENDPEHPVTFEVGKTYSVKLAISHPGCGWVSVQHDFTIIEPDSVDYHYEDSSGNDQTEFCLGEDVYVNGSATLNTSNYFMDLWIVDSNGEYDWISGAGWISGSPDFVNITDLFENDPQHPITFQVGETYSVKLAINDPNCGWVSLQHDFTIIEPDSVDYHYEDQNGNDKTQFCIGEDVFVNGSATLNTSNYFMDLWIVDSNGDYDWISGAGWISGSPDFVNITELFENDPEHPVTFQVGETYSVKLAINDPNCGWVSLQHDFEIIDCCEDFNEADFSLGVDFDYNFWIGGYEGYEFLDATHEWYVFSSPNEEGGPYTLENQVTTTGDNAFVLFTDGVFDLYYTVIHKVITDCGEICYAQVQYQKEGKNPEEYTNVKAAEIDCSFLDEILPPKCEELTTPTNLQVEGSTLTWDPVPGAAYYIVSSPTGDVPQIDCRCKLEISIVPITTETNSVVVPEGLQSRCFSWRVTAVCEDGTESQPSSPQCFSPIRSAIENNFVKATVYPNPSRGDMNFEVETTTDTDVTIEIFNLYGTKVHALEMSAKKDLVGSAQWNGTSTLKTGIYFVIFKTDSEVISKKVIVKK
ncbi:trypsin-like serine protease [uncultured Dokdonia sp.]|uniref:trypsin-like serine protease n=1 Tax=uncultured Dokdonia sp. TaxID=575653 RepID=UPI00261729D3|nr:trypsin-like serine protease [uncultured Dokdonia sp.]